MVTTLTDSNDNFFVDETNNPTFSHSDGGGPNDITVDASSDNSTDNFFVDEEIPSVLGSVSVT